MPPDTRPAQLFEGRPAGKPWDVLVVGLGTAGAAALQCAAQEGLNVLGIERLGGLGGQSTLGGVSFEDPVSARLLELERKCERIPVKYDTSLLGVWRENGRLTGLRIISNGWIEDLPAKLVIDATGCAAVARMCGLEVRRGRAFDGVMAPCVRADVWVENGGRVRPHYWNTDCSLAGGLVERSGHIAALCRGRHLFWKERGGKAGRMLRPGYLPGAREEARVVTEVVWSLGDVLCNRAVCDPVFYAFTPEDLPVVQQDYAFESWATQDWKVLCGLPMFGYASAIPYGCLVARGVDGLLVPSKHFGVSHDLGGGLRLQAEMRKSGIAAGCAAKVALGLGCALREVPYGVLKGVLERHGLPGARRRDGVGTVHGAAVGRLDDGGIVEALRVDVSRTGEWWYAKADGGAMERAAYAYWLCRERRLCGDAAGRRVLSDRLAGALAEGGRFAGNFAVALGLMEDVRGLAALRSLAARDGGIEDPVVRGAFPNRIKALLLLGRFADEASGRVLMGILEDGARGFVRGLEGAGAFDCVEQLRFQAVSYAAMALAAILRVHRNASLSCQAMAWQGRLVSGAEVGRNPPWWRLGKVRFG